MSRAAHASGGGGTALSVALGVLLTLLLPALVTTDATAPAVAGLVLALAALLVLAPRSFSRAAWDQLAVAPIGDAPPPLLHGRVTDPVHHPLRPRAPGNA